MALQRKIEAVSVIVSAGNHASYFPGAQLMILKLIFDPTSGKVLGAQAVGGEGVDKRIDVIATAMHFGATVFDLATLDLCYAPPFGSAKDPIHLAAFVASNHLDGMMPILSPAADLEGVQIVDVRTEAEFAEARLPGAIHIRLEELRDRLNTLDPSLPTAVLCESGRRSHVGACILKQQGFTDVVNVSGGMYMQRHARPDRVER